MILPPLIIAILLPILGKDIAIVIIGHGVDQNTIFGLGKKLTQSIVGIAGGAILGIGALAIVIIYFQGKDVNGARRKQPRVKKKRG